MKSVIVEFGPVDIKNGNVAFLVRGSVAVLSSAGTTVETPELRDLMPGTIFQAKKPEDEAFLGTYEAIKVENPSGVALPTIPYPVDKFVRVIVARVVDKTAVKK